MRHVVAKREVAHLWAHRTQDSARTSTGNFYFDGDTIYSYGSHFPVAKHVTNATGDRAVLLTTRTYSITTPSHVSLVRRAIPDDTPIFHVPLNGGWRDAQTESILAEYSASIEQLSIIAARAKGHRDWKVAALVAKVDEANAYCEFFGLVERFDQLPDERLAEIKKADNARRAEERAREKVRQAKIEAENAEAIKAWISGASNHFPYAIRKPYLRIVGNEVQTSLGVRFPVRHAKRGLALVNAVVAKGEAWQRNGVKCRLGAYQIDRIDPNGDVHAGCHHVPYAEIKRIEPELIAAVATETAPEDDYDILN